MPWHSSSRLDGGIDMAVHYHMINGSNPELHQEFGCHDEQRRKSAAILTIGKNKLNRKLCNLRKMSMNEGLLTRSKRDF